MELSREEMLNQLAELELEHDQLNHIIDDRTNNLTNSTFMYQKLKKRRLFLRDQIKLIRSKLYPNIVA